uniref:Nucleolar protein 7 n=1 Tax=Latimeria chalumnae TaxID=7897 RepID=H3AD96_LATCH
VLKCNNMASKRTRRAVAAAEKESGGKEEKKEVMESGGAGGNEKEEEEEDDDDDAAPDEVPFQQAREEAVRSIKQALESVKREKLLLKEKRRQRQELFKEQKKRKLLPEALLEEVAAASQTSFIKSLGNIHKVHSCEDSEKPEEGNSSEGSEEEDEEEALDNRLKESYMAVRLKDQGQINLQQERAQDFIQDCLYGPGSNRTTANELFSLSNKKCFNKKAAVQFVDKSWGLEKKQKAEKFKKKWLQKQGVGTN